MLSDNLLSSIIINRMHKVIKIKNRNNAYLIILLYYLDLRINRSEWYYFILFWFYHLVISWIRISTHTNYYYYLQVLFIKINACKLSKTLNNEVSNKYIKTKYYFQNSW